jgi:transposase
MCIHWLGTATRDDSYQFGSLAVLAPLLERMDLAGIIDRHIPANPQAEFAYGPIVRLLVAARLSSPVALVNVPDWARQTGAELLWSIPPDKLNDDRLGRALDAFYYERHSILASLALHGDYTQSRPRADPAPDYQQLDSNDPPAHITFGHSAHNNKILQAGVTVAIDDLGAVPIFGHLTDGNHNGHTAIAEQFDLLRQHLQPRRLLLMSDRGTFSAGHAARCHREGFSILCSVPWNDYRALYDCHRAELCWRQASYLSIEQQRRRACASTLPREHYELAVLHHDLIDPATKQALLCRVLFVYSTADAKVARATRAKAVAKLTAGLEQLARSVREGRRHTDPQAVARRVVKLFGKRGTAAYFTWELQPLSAAEQAALPAPARGCRLPTHRFVYHFDAARAEAAAHYDGRSALVTTAPLNQSGDTLFSQFKQQNEVELSHHQWKTPLAVHPLFLKNPQRIESLVHVLLMALMAYHLLQRLYRQHVAPDAADTEKRMTTETILRAFSAYTVQVKPHRSGRVVFPNQLSERQRQIIQRLGFPSPAQILARRLPRPP